MEQPPLRARTESLATLWVLLGMNALVYVGWQLALRNASPNPILASRDPFVAFMSNNFTVSLDGVLSGRVWTLLTTAFSHVDPMHLLFNCLALWVFGRDVLRVCGSLAFVHLYVVGALLASVGHLAYSLVASDPSPALGASGAAMAISVVYAALFPRRILLINFFIPVPAALAVAVYVVLDLIGALGGNTDNVAHAAHLGGAVYGFLFWLVWVRPRVRRAPPVEPQGSWAERRGPPRPWR